MAEIGTAYPEPCGGTTYMKLFYSEELACKSQQAEN